MPDRTIMSSGSYDANKRGEPEKPQEFYVKIRRGLTWSYWSANGEVFLQDEATDTGSYRDAQDLVRGFMDQSDVDSCEVEIVTK